MKNFKNISELTKDFEKLLRDKETLNTNKDNDVGSILKNLYTKGTVTIDNTGFVEEVEEEEDNVYYITDDDLEVDARNNIYEYSEEYLQKYKIKSKDKKITQTCPNWEEVDFSNVKNKPKVVSFQRRKQKR